VRLRRIHVLVLLPRSLAPRPQTLSVKLDASPVYRSPPQNHTGDLLTPATHPFPDLRSPGGAEFPIHAEPSNNNKGAPRGQACLRENQRAAVGNRPKPLAALALLESRARPPAAAPLLPGNSISQQCQVSTMPFFRTFLHAARLNSTLLICLLCAQLLH
jgi:hypothetical protein